VKVILSETAVTTGKQNWVNRISLSNTCIFFVKLFCPLA
jgi:hypothetical protein